ncbi:MAG: GNAT family N-acetyltransferase [Proteobacteria bacterium]|nr:GNAT family N-acetyltransferase [Pseudomonadota bacterium]
MASQPQPAITWREDMIPQDVTLIERFASASGFFRPDEVLLAADFAAEHLSKGPESGYNFIFAQEEVQTLGYACYGHIPGTLHSWSLYWIIVNQNTRSRGLGSQLLAQVEQRVAAAGGERLYIETSSQPMYHPTRRFYQSRGYTLLTVLEDFYARGDGKVIYAKTMPDLAKG